MKNHELVALLIKLDPNAEVVLAPQLEAACLSVQKVGEAEVVKRQNGRYYPQEDGENRKTERVIFFRPF